MFQNEMKITKKSKFIGQYLVNFAHVYNFYLASRYTIDPQGIDHVTFSVKNENVKSENFYVYFYVFFMYICIFLCRYFYVYIYILYIFEYFYVYL